MKKNYKCEVKIEILKKKRPVSILRFTITITYSRSVQSITMLLEALGPLQPTIKGIQESKPPFCSITMIYECETGSH